MTGTKSPAPLRKVQGLGFQRAADDQAYSENRAERQFPSDASEVAPSIHVRRDGAFYRVQILPPEALPKGMSRPETHGSYTSAMMAAKWLGVATGWPIVDLAKAR